MKFRVLYIFVCLQIALSNRCLAQAGPPPMPPGPLGNFDTAFLETYISRMKALTSEHPIYVEISGNNLILHRDGQQESVRVLPDIYQALKDVAHVPFATYLELAPLASADMPLTAAQISRLKDLDAKIVAARNALGDGHFSEVQLIRQKKMIDNSLNLLRATENAKEIDHSTLNNFARGEETLMMENSNDAACYQIEEMHSQMLRWKRTVTVEEWNHLIAINKSGHQPRYRNAATQYFSWLFNAPDAPKWVYPGESDRVIYAESVPKTQDTGDELMSILIDADASVAFFGNRWRLSEDVLSDGAARCIARLPPADRVWH
jgi:hypothetical protein